MESMQVMAEAMRGLVGDGDDLAWWQAGVRAAIIFASTWALLRLAGRRAFAQKTSFDLCIVLLLGAVLSRAVVGATSFAVAFAASLVLVLLHRAVGWLSSRYPGFDRATGGHALDLMRAGELDRERMTRAMLTEEDLKANLRATLQTDSFDDLGRVVLERDGKVTFVRAPRDAPADTTGHAASAVARGNGVPMRASGARR
ncbi:DUF421 domain-containing protein [Cupriavidus necator]|uniref:DUF421 domain-containing protein n=1 Tax=Cupriavidus necator TaxID=106590 RepID=UPI00278A559D|nr:YetF domain-containing protein [Cupriavidus necator]MDQ0142309.1 uncharacterized membrane protein YcaP (DUF421 family) [Cupriavidus necator]